MSAVSYLQAINDFHHIVVMAMNSLRRVRRLCSSIITPVKHLTYLNIHQRVVDQTSKKISSFNNSNKNKSKENPGVWEANVETMCFSSIALIKV